MSLYINSGLTWLMLVGLLAFIVLISTYAITATQYYLASHGIKHGREPPGIPYWIPLFGNLLDFFGDPQENMAKIAATYGNSPVKVRMGPVSAYILSSPEYFATLLKSHKNLSPKPLMAIALKNMFGAPKSAFQLYENDRSGLAPTLPPDSKLKPSERVFFHQRNAALKYLSGEPLNKMTERFMGLLSKRLFEDQSIGIKWTNFSDLTLFMQDKIFETALEALCGPHLVRQTPSFISDFWEYIDCLPTLVFGLPRWMTPKSYAARDKVLRGIMKWHVFSRKHEDYHDLGDEVPEWEEFWGSKYLKARQAYGQTAGMDDEALAAEELALLAAANANSIVAAIWFLFFINQDHSLKRRVESEMSAAVITTSPAQPVEFDVKKLTDGPLLQSIYAETLRLRIAVQMNRTPVHNDHMLGPWLMKKGRMITFNTLVPGQLASFWNEGGEGSPHPVSEFWGERFLVYPDNPKSGPLRANTTTIEARENAGRDPYFSAEGLAGAFLPYGGGSWMCPGRNFAKQEMIGSFALFSHYFEIDINEDDAKGVKPDMAFYGQGALPMKGALPFKIRRKSKK